MVMLAGFESPDHRLRYLAALESSSFSTQLVGSSYVRRGQVRRGHILAEYISNFCRFVSGTASTAVSMVSSLEMMTGLGEMA